MPAHDTRPWPRAPISFILHRRARWMQTRLEDDADVPIFEVPQRLDHFERHFSVRRALHVDADEKLVLAPGSRMRRMLSTQSRDRSQAQLRELQREACIRCWPPTMSSMSLMLSRVADIGLIGGRASRRSRREQLSLCLKRARTTIASVNLFTGNEASREATPGVALRYTNAQTLESDLATAEHRLDAAAAT